MLRTAGHGGSGGWAWGDIGESCTLMPWYLVGDLGLQTSQSLQPRLYPLQGWPKAQGQATFHFPSRPIAAPLVTTSLSPLG